MYDDPKKELNRLDELIRKADDKDEKFERFYAEIYKEFGEKKPEHEEDYLKDILEEIPSLGKEGRNTYMDNARHSAPAVRKENNLPLVLAICLECLGIAGVALWWIARLI